MKKILALALLASVAAPTWAADKKADMSPEKQAAMQKWMEFSTPGASHKMLADLAGTWNYSSKWWETADAKPEESSGKSKFKTILNGRFLQQEFKGKSMGMPFEGLGITGYNNLTKKFESFWIDSMTTAMMHGQGDYDPEQKMISESGEHACPMTDSKTAKYRTEWKMIDKNNMVFTMYGHGMDGKSPEFKSMEITYKRK